jgi:hypothetical protein
MLVAAGFALKVEGDLDIQEVDNSEDPLVF